ncbi:MAG: c-type cytochrome [Chloroflexi bacterium]|nr:c-type cytochrome [Chloroflexota bacterium]
MKFRLLFSFVFVVLLLSLLATAVAAQGEPPAPYAGLKNPFAWDDTSAQKAGQGLYQRSCSGCHGPGGNNIASADFSKAAYSQNLEGKPDYYFWLLSEGRLNLGMPPFKSSLTEEQRWQVLTYIWSLGMKTAAGVTPSPSQPPAAGVGGSLLLTVPEQARSGQPVTISASLKDKEGKPVGGATIKFYIMVDFFASGPMEIGEAVTNDQGVAVLEYAPRETGDVAVVARNEGIEATSTLNLSEAARPFYQAEAGLRLPAPGIGLFIGPQAALQVGEMGKAPTSALYLPGGMPSWLLFLVVTIGLIWFTYFRVIYQIFRIPIANEIRDIDTRLVPLIGMTIVVLVGSLLVTMLLTGPYSHFHLIR